LTVRGPELGRPTLLTISGVAERISKIAPDTAATVERIRHWTREGLMVPAEDHHAGAGKHRRYEDRVAPYETAVLNTIASAGIHVASARYLKATMAKIREALPDWLQNQAPLYLQIRFVNAGSDPIAELSEAVPALASDLLIVVDLARLFERVEGTPK
jgi:DNA-binding transcriptional MerR regulator